MNIDEVKTPAFLIDKEVMERNCERMRRRALELDVVLRPHVKTHKTVEGTRLQLGRDLKGVTVSTLAEATFLIAAGFDDLTYAFPLAPDRIEDVAVLQGEGVRLQVLIDHSESFEALSRFARRKHVRFEVFLKVDCGNRRAGVDPQSVSAVDLAARLSGDEGIRFRGILTHAGQAYGARSGQEIRAFAEIERRTMVDFAERLKVHGIPCPVVSIGSTPTAVRADHLAGITEIRPGNYALFDKFQVDIGTCNAQDCAGTVLATVVGVYPEARRMVIDAGALALSKDPGATHIHRETVFGAVTGFPGLKIMSLSQEHGVLEVDRSLEMTDFHIGQKLRIIPNHSCLAAALFSNYLVIQDGRVVDRWVPVRGW